MMEGKLGICVSCNQNKKIAAKKMCNCCYKKQFFKKECIDCKKIKCIICKGRCINCYIKERRKDPIFLENERNLGRISYRKRKGIPLDAPLGYRKKHGYINIHGYKKITKKHPNANKQGSISEHIFVMSNHLGRPLRKGENVHHINGVRDDNRIENLELWNTRQPSGQRVHQKIEFYKEFLTDYGYRVIKKREKKQKVEGNNNHGQLQLFG